jgi:hypothetical protein
VSGRQESLRYRSTRQLSRRILRPSSVNYLVRSRPLYVRLHPTAWGVLGSASHTNKPSFIQAMEAARTSTAEGSNRCDVRLLKVCDHRDIGKNAFRGAFPAFVTSLTGLKHLYAPANSPSLAHPASVPATRFMKVTPRELLQRDPAGRDDGSYGLDRSVRSHAPMLCARSLLARLMRHRRLVVA